MVDTASDGDWTGMGLLGDVRTAEIESRVVVALPPERVYRLLREGEGTNERILEVIDESPADSPGTVLRLRVQSGRSAAWIRSCVLADDPPHSLSMTCAPAMPGLGKFKTSYRYDLCENAGGSTLVSAVARVPVGAGGWIVRLRGEAELQERLDRAMREWAECVAAAPEESGHDSHAASGRAAPRVRTIRQIRVRQAVMVAISVAFGVVGAIGSHRWQNALTAVLVVSVLQWLGVRFVAILRRYTVT